MAYGPLRTGGDAAVLGFKLLSIMQLSRRFSKQNQVKARLSPI